MRRRHPAYGTALPSKPSSGLHPDRYRTQMCRDGTACPRKVCFFAHNAQEMRTPSGPSTAGGPAGSPGGATPAPGESSSGGVPQQLALMAMPEAGGAIATAVGSAGPQGSWQERQQQQQQQQPEGSLNSFSSAGGDGIADLALLLHAPLSLTGNSSGAAPQMVSLPAAPVTTNPSATLVMPQEQPLLQPYSAAAVTSMPALAMSSQPPSSQWSYAAAGHPHSSCSPALSSYGLPSVSPHNTVLLPAQSAGTAAAAQPHTMGAVAAGAAELGGWRPLLSAPTTNALAQQLSGLRATAPLPAMQQIQVVGNQQGGLMGMVHLGSSLSGGVMGGGAETTGLVSIQQPVMMMMHNNGLGMLPHHHQQVLFNQQQQPQQLLLMSHHHQQLQLQQLQYQGTMQPVPTAMGAAFAHPFQTPF